MIVEISNIVNGNVQYDSSYICSRVHVEYPILELVDGVTGSMYHIKLEHYQVFSVIPDSEIHGVYALMRCP